MTYLYLVFFGVLIVVSVFYRFRIGNDHRTNVILFLTAFLLWLLQCFKNPFLLPDGDTYYNAFNIIDGISFQDLSQERVGMKMEIGYIYINKILSYITNDPLILFIVTGSIILTGPIFLIKKYSKYVVLSILLYIAYAYVDSLAIIRQYMAYSFVFFSFPYILERKLIKFILLILVAILIHQSAICCLPIYFLYHTKNNKSILSYIVIGSIILSIFFIEISSFFKGYETYTAKSYSTIGTAVIMAMTLLIRCYIMKNHIFDAGIEKLLSIILIIALSTSIIGSFLPGMWYRIIKYYSFASVFLTLPNTLSYIKNRVYRYGFAMTCSLIFFSLLYSYFNHTEYTYEFIWDN